MLQQTYTKQICSYIAWASQGLSLLMYSQALEDYDLCMKCKICMYIKSLKVLQILYCVNCSAKKSTFEWEHVDGVREKTVFHWLRNTEEAVTFFRPLKPKPGENDYAKTFPLNHVTKEKYDRGKNFSKSELIDTSSEFAPKHYLCFTNHKAVLTFCQGALHAVTLLCPWILGNNTNLVRETNTCSFRVHGWRIKW